LKPALFWRLLAPGGSIMYTHAQSHAHRHAHMHMHIHMHMHMHTRSLSLELSLTISHPVRSVSPGAVAPTPPCPPPPRSKAKAAAAHVACIVAWRVTLPVAARVQKAARMTRKIHVDSATGGLRALSTSTQLGARGAGTGVHTGNSLDPGRSPAPRSHIFYAHLLHHRPAHADPCCRTSASMFPFVERCHVWVV
jgi:hypothetical protein